METPPDKVDNSPWSRPVRKKNIAHVGGALEGRDLELHANEVTTRGTAKSAKRLLICLSPGSQNVRSCGLKNTYKSRGRICGQASPRPRIFSAADTRDIWDRLSLRARRAGCPHKYPAQ